MGVTTSRNPGWRRVRALLATGLVLGVGAGATLAAWNDSEFTTAQFSSASFDLKGAVNGETPSDHPSGEPAILTFSAANRMLPGQTTYAGFYLQLGSDSVPAEVAVIPSDSNAEGLGRYLVYGMALTPDSTCDQTAFDQGQVIVAAGSPLDLPSPSSFRVDPTANVCVAVTFPPDAPTAAQGLQAAVSWEFRGTATSN